MLKKLGRKLKKGLKKAGPMIGLLGAAALAAKARKKDQGALTADMDRSMVPMSKRMVQGLNFPASTNLSGMNEIAARGSIDDKNDYYKKGGRVGCGKAKRGFGRALRKK
tara:strand:+ start:1065 stop:1391 length:327 start_codon:yes stop_codon:yes gene_type:complete